MMVNLSRKHIAGYRRGALRFPRAAVLGVDPPKHEGRCCERLRDRCRAVGSEKSRRRRRPNSSKLPGLPRPSAPTSCRQIAISVHGMVRGSVPTARWPWIQAQTDHTWLQRREKPRDRVLGAGGRRRCTASGRTAEWIVETIQPPAGSFESRRSRSARSVARPLARRWQQNPTRSDSAPAASALKLSETQ